MARGVDDRQPIMRTQVRVREEPLGWAWIGVGLLAVIGVSAVMNAPRHEVEAQRGRSQRRG